MRLNIKMVLKITLVILFLVLTFYIYGITRPDISRAQEIQMLRAVGRGDIEKVEQMLDARYPVNHRDRGYRTAPLHRAAGANQIEMMKYLISKGAWLNIQDLSLLTPLHRAAKGKNADTVKFLIQAGAKIDKTGEVGAFDSTDRKYTPLHSACLSPNKSFEIVKALVDAGANLKAKNYVGETPLHIAIKNLDYKYTSMDIIKYLVENGAPLDVKDNKGCTPMHYSISHVKLVAYLLIKGGDLTIKNNEGYAPFRGFEEGAPSWVFSYVLQKAMTPEVQKLIKEKKLEEVTKILEEEQEAARLRDRPRVRAMEEKERQKRMGPDYQKKAKEIRAKKLKELEEKVAREKAQRKNIK